MTAFIIEITQLAEKWKQELQLESTGWKYEPKSASNCLEELKEIINKHKEIRPEKAYKEDDISKL